jgi:hypothetical protein
MADETELPQEPKQNVVKLRPNQKAVPEKEEGIPVDDYLKEAIGKLSGVIIIGYTQDKDELEYFASSFEDSSEVVWLLERFKFILLSEPDDL